MGLSTSGLLGGWDTERPARDERVCCFVTCKVSECRDVYLGKGEGGLEGLDETYRRTLREMECGSLTGSMDG